MNERSKNSHNTSGDQEINPGDAAPDPAVDSRQDSGTNQNGETDFSKQSEQVIAETVGEFVINLHR